MSENFKKTIEEAIRTTNAINPFEFVRVKGKIEKIILPVEVANLLKTKTLSAKDVGDNTISYFTGIPCEVNQDVKTIQYVISGVVENDKKTTCEIAGLSLRPLTELYKPLNALEIVKNKKVDVAYLFEMIDLFGKEALKQYNLSCYGIKKKLTQKEFKLLKEELL